MAVEVVPDAVLNSPRAVEEVPDGVVICPMAVA